MTSGGNSDRECLVLCEFIGHGDVCFTYVQQTFSPRVQMEGFDGQHRYTQSDI